jgi:hypothetical protein
LEREWYEHLFFVGRRRMAALLVRSVLEITMKDEREELIERLRDMVAVLRNQDVLDVYDADDIEKAAALLAADAQAGGEAVGEFVGIPDGPNGEVQTVFVEFYDQSVRVPGRKLYTHPQQQAVPLTEDPRR